MGYIYRIQDGRADSQIGYYTHWPIPEKYSKEQLVGRGVHTMNRS